MSPLFISEALYSCSNRMAEAISWVRVILDIEIILCLDLNCSLNPSTGPMAKIRFSPEIATSDKRLAISKLVN